jgi:hypothetical protein
MNSPLTSEGITNVPQGPQRVVLTFGLGRLLPLKTRDEILAHVEGLKTGENCPLIHCFRHLTPCTVEAYVVEVPAPCADKLLR